LPADQRDQGPGQLRLIKYDGYRLRLERDGDRVRLIKRGNNAQTSDQLTSAVGESGH
jgi:ATP-dependent DNA ligase